MATVHELTLYCSEGGDAYPRPVEAVRLGLFTTIDKAESVMLDQLAGDYTTWSPDSVVGFTLEEIALDQKPRFHRRRHYDATGAFRGEIKAEELDKPFNGREPDTCGFRRGELVEFVQGDKLQIGVVAGLPLSPDEAARFGESWDVRGDDDCYLVLMSADDHAHLRQCELFRARGRIDAKMMEGLLARMPG